MYSIQATNQFKRDTKLCVKRGLNIELLSQVIEFFGLVAGLTKVLCL